MSVGKIPVERLFTEWEFLSTNQAHWLLPVCKGGGWQIVMGHMIETCGIFIPYLPA